MVLAKLVGFACATSVCAGCCHRFACGVAFPAPAFAALMVAKLMKMPAARSAARPVKKPAAAQKPTPPSSTSERPPAWVSGGSSARPRKGTPWQGTLSDLRRKQQSSKRGAALLKSRGVHRKKPAAAPGQLFVPYVPVHSIFKKSIIQKINNSIIQSWKLTL